MDLYCAAVITQNRVFALALDEESELPVLSEQPQAIYARYHGAAHVYRLFPDFRGGELVLTSRASIEPVGPAMPIRPLVMLSTSQHREMCEAVRAIAPPPAPQFCRAARSFARGA